MIQKSRLWATCWCCCPPFFFFIFFYSFEYRFMLPSTFMLWSFCWFLSFRVIWNFSVSKSLQTVISCFRLFEIFQTVQCWNRCKSDFLFQIVWNLSNCSVLKSLQTVISSFKLFEIFQIEYDLENLARMRLHGSMCAQIFYFSCWNSGGFFLGKPAAIEQYYGP